MRKSKAFKLLICIDQFFAVLILNANEDQTISGHVGYKSLMTGKKRYKFTEKFIDFIFLPFEKNHCFNSIEWDRLK